MTDLRKIAAAMGGEVRGSAASFPTPGHSSKDRGSWAYDNPDAPDGVWIGSGNGGDPLAIKDELRAKGVLPERKGDARGWHVTGTYEFRDETGSALYRTRRHEHATKPKRFDVQRPDGGGGWIKGIGGARRVLYRLPELLAADPAEPVYLVEGERKADKLAAWGLVATAVAFGCKGWRKCYAAALAGRTVAILPDNDQPGRSFADSARRDIETAGGTVRIVALPGLPDKGDIMDWLGTADELRLLTRAALTVSPVSPALSPENGAALLDAVQAFLGRFVAYPLPEASVAHALWIAHAHVMDAWESTPRIAFLSPEPASGKTRALEITATLVPNPVEAVNVTPAYLFRKVADPAGRPTILFDEADTVFGPKAKDNEETRGLLNAGHRKGAVAGRCVVRGKLVETEEIPAYCAVAIAGLGNLPDTILTRSIIVRMRRRAPGERVEQFRRRINAPEGEALRDRLAAWAEAIADSIRDDFPDMPDGIEDRNADVWEALLAVADAAGGDWPGRARAAAVALVASAHEQSASLGVKLLTDIRDAMGENDAMFTVTLLERLKDMEESPWADLKGKPLDAGRLARMLKPYGVTPGTVRDGAQTAKGYSREGLADAWARYLPSPPMEAVTAVTLPGDWAAVVAEEVALRNGSL